jgi:hypothetical protein
MIATIRFVLALFATPIEWKRRRLSAWPEISCWADQAEEGVTVGQGARLPGGAYRMAFPLVVE